MKAALVSSVTLLLATVNSKASYAYSGPAYATYYNYASYNY